MKRLKIAIAGNPNCGKTTLFNALTGAHQQVGNWPGVTVERIIGEYAHDGKQVEVTDLPGIYSLSAYSIDETIARQHILEEKPDLVVNIVDATNLERNLFLTTQLLEMRVPMIVVLNMMDLAKKRRIRVEIEHLARHLGCPVLPVVAAKCTGIEKLKDTIQVAAEAGAVSQTRVTYDSELEKAIERVGGQLTPIAQQAGVNERWLAIKVLEGDDVAAKYVQDGEINEVVKLETARVERHTGDDIDVVIADGRYGFIHGLALDVVHRESEVRKTVSDSIDKILLNRLLGIPVFLLIMYLVFMVTINLGAPFVDFFDKICGTIFVDGLGALLGMLHVPQWLSTVLADGLGGGIQTVATFIPPIFLIFACLAFLEDSGYMARGAFVMDRFLRMVGLPGKAFIPMLVGFGCNVPAIMATRTLENERDRVLTMLMNPFMSCGARLPVYTLFVAAFFPASGGVVLFTLYFTGILLAIISGIIFKNTILQGEPATFVMELPPYHMPTLRGIMFHTWVRLKDFVLRAGQVILVVVMVLSFLNSWGTDGSFGNSGSEKSVLSSISKKAAVVFRPMGLRQENWPAAVGLFTGVFAKEAIVGTLDNLYTQLDKSSVAAADITVEEEKFDFWQGIIDAFAAVPAGLHSLVGSREEDQAAAGAADEVGQASTGTIMLRYFDGKIGAFAYLLFILLYAPCVATIAAIYREAGLRWSVFSVCYLTTVAWMVSTAFYQLGTFTQHPGSSAGWLAAVAGVLAVLMSSLKIMGRKTYYAG
jgi:ferrous iron transport protein B